jgi:DNA-binding LacI/PurR family transcriptional regulator
MHDHTLKELSEQLGISPSTVSRALSGQDLKRAGARRRAEQIREMAARLGYEPNSVARSLKTNRRQVVGLIVPDILNDYYALAATFVQETLAAEGYRVLLCVTNDDPATEDAHMRVLREERVAGIVTVPSPRPASFKNLPRGDAQIPTVDLVRQGPTQNIDAVLIDDVNAGLQGTQHLIDLGHRQIAILTGPASISTAQQRLAGYQQALEKAGIPFDESLVKSGAYRRDVARTLTLELLDRPARPTALIATSNELVIGALQALIQRQISVPGKLSLVGFGNADWFPLLRPALTTVVLPIREMAMVAAHMLLTRIRASNAEQNQGVGEKTPIISRYQGHLLVRDSTCPPAIQAQEKGNV